MILTIPEHRDFLTTPSELVEKGEDVSAIIAELLADVDQIGVGLSAVQIGHHKQVIVAQLDGPEKPFTIALNPRFMAQRAITAVGIEGCLSVPGQQYFVRRYTDIIASWLDQNFKPRSRRLQGFAARVWQHEVGHNRGILIADIGQPVPTEQTADATLVA